MHLAVAGKLTGPVTKWFVAAAVIVIGLGAWILFASKLTDVQNNEASSWLPNTAESTKALNKLAPFQSQNDIPTIVVYHRDGGLTAADFSVISDQATEIGSIDGVVPGKNGAPTVAFPADAASGQQQGLVSSDGTVAMSVVTFNLGSDGWNKLPPVADKIREIAAINGVDVHLAGPGGQAADSAEAFAGMARDSGRVFYATWHSREAAGVEPARQWIAGRKIRRVSCTWKEDVRVWHPGQEWIWEPGIGVFDPGINALSVLTRILPEPLLLQSAELGFPANKPAPIAANLQFETGGAPLSVAFDFDQRGPQTWDIVVDAEDGSLKLSMGASQLAIDGVAVDLGDDPEYARLYRRFAELLARRESDADLAPFRHVADAFLLGRRTQLQPFDWNG